MEYGYLARESEGVNKTTRKMFIKLMSVFYIRVCNHLISWKGFY